MSRKGKRSILQNLFHAFMLLLRVMLLSAPALLHALIMPAAVSRPHLRVRTSVVLMKDDTAGQGFGKQTVEEQAAARGREQLEALRAATAERGYDSTLQGLQDKIEEPAPSPEELQQFKSQITLGLAGFLIVGGVLSLVVGGSLWEPKGFNEDGTPPVDDTPAFGFVPKGMPSAPPPADGESTPSWASPVAETPPVAEASPVAE